MFVLGMLCSIYSFDLELARAQIALIFGKKDSKVIASNVRLMEAGFTWAEENLDFKYRIPADPVAEPQVVVSGNTAIALGVLASGMDICAMYPITPRHVVVALPGRMLRARRRPRSPGRRRDRRLCVRDRRLVRRPLRGDDHVGPRLFAEAGRPGPGGDGRDPARRRQRAARRPEHRPADQGRAGRPADGDLRQPRRRAEGRDGGQRHRGLLLRDDHRAQDRRDLQHGRRRAVGRQPVDGAAALPASELQRGVAGAADRPDARPRGRQALRLGCRDRHRAPLHPRAARRHAHHHRPGARPHEQGRLRPVDQRGRPARTQPEARGAAEDAASRRRSTAPPRATCCSSAGAERRARSRRPSTGCAPGASRCRRCTCASSSRCLRESARSCGASGA